MLSTALTPMVAQDLTSLNTMGLASRAAAFVRHTCSDDLDALSDLAGRYDNVLILGGGSNVVLPPRVESLVIKVESRGIVRKDETADAWIIEAQAGEAWHEFVDGCLANGWQGLENLALIPGTVGAAPVQNIGAYGVELDQRFHSLLAWNLRERRMVEMGPADCGFAYRDSVFKRARAGEWLIAAVRFRLPKAWTPMMDYPDLRNHPALQEPEECSARRIFDAVCDIRRRKLPDPRVLGNAGSFFKNPVVEGDRFQALKREFPGLVAYAQPEGRYKLAAGWLLDQAGWKGKRMGPVGMHDRQALVLVNHGGATADDVALLSAAVRADVMAHFGVMLEQEPVNAV